MFKNWHTYLTRTGLAMAMTLFVLAGCSNFDNPLGPQSPAGQSAQATGEQTDPAAKSLGSAVGGALNTTRSVVQGIQNTSTTIIANVGGELRLVDPNGKYIYRLIIPAGALSNDTVISMAAPSASDAVLQFGPHGLNFNIPVTLTMAFDPSMNQDQIQGSADVYWYNPSTGGWEGQNGTSVLLEGAPGGDKIASTAKLNHFSRYAHGGDRPIQKQEYYGYESTDRDNYGYGYHGY